MNSRDTDLSPRTQRDNADEIRRQLRAGQRRWVMVTSVVLVVVLGFIMVQFLRDATLFFRNVDEGHRTARRTRRSSVSSPGPCDS